MNENGLEPRICRVYNLKTGDEATYIGLCPSEAVIAAYAQHEAKDFNTWNYGQHRYPVEFGDKTVVCGDWCTKL